MVAPKWRYAGLVPSVQIKNVPPEIHSVLRRRADAAGQSLQAYLLAELTKQADKPTHKELFDRIEQEHSGGSMSFAHAASLIRADRDARS
jgi:antitoxin FitA